MAQTNLMIGVRVKWWVNPLMKVLTAIAWLVGPFLTEDQADQISARLGRFVADRGLRLTVK